MSDEKPKTNFSSNDEFSIGIKTKSPEKSKTWEAGAVNDMIDENMRRPMKRTFKTRLAKKESQRMVKQSVLLMGLTLVVLIVLVIWGVPALIRLAGLLGDIKNSSTPIANEDKIPPFAPQLNLNYDATSSAKINIGGFAEAGSTVKLTNNDIDAGEVVVSDDGSFEFPSVELYQDENVISAISIDPAGNSSEKSSTRTIVFDNKPPKLEITNPDNGQSFGDQLNRSIDVEGESENGAEVYVNARLAIVNSEGKFSQKISLNEGDNEIVVRAVDNAGNESEEKLNVRYEL